MESHPLREDVLVALRNLRNPAELRSSSLLKDPAVRTGLPLSSSNPSPDDLALALSTRLTAIIDGLRPNGKEDLKQRGFLHYYTLHYLFRQDQSPQSVQHILGVGRTQLYKLRNEAIDNLATILVANAPLELTVPFSEPIPATMDFMGREAELSLYRQQLALQNLAVIHGFAGTGKTALAAQLALECQQVGHSVIWVTFYRGVNDELSNFLEILAYALQHFGNDGLLDFLTASTQGARPYPDDARIHYAVNCLSASNIILCLDDVHLVEEAPTIQRFLGRLVPRQQSARVPLIVASRTVPPFAQGRHIAPLAGMSEQDSRQLICSTGVDWLDESDLAELQQRTDGNTAFIKFFVAWAKSARLEHLTPSERTARIRAFIAQLGWSPSSRSFLLSEVISSLDEIAQAVLERGALCRKSINLKSEALMLMFPDLDPSQVRLAFTQLEHRNLLIRQGDTAYYRLHDLVRNYALAQLEQNASRRESLHHPLAQYYAASGDFIEAAFHQCQANDFSAAVKLLIQHADELIGKGQAGAMIALAGQIPAAELSPDLCLAWYSELTSAWQAAGRFEVDAVAYLSRALDLTHDISHGERYALLLAQEGLQALREAGEHQPWDLPFLQRLATVLTDEMRQAKIALSRARHTETAVQLPEALSEARQIIRQAQDTQSWSIEAASYGRSLLLAQQIDDMLTQREAYQRLGEVLERLGHSEEAAEAYRKELALYDEALPELSAH